MSGSKVRRTMPGTQQLLNKWELLILWSKTQWVTRSRGSTLQGHTKGEEAGSQFGQPRTQACLQRCPAGGIASVFLASDAGHLFTSPCGCALTHQAPGPVLCPPSSAGWREV